MDIGKNESPFSLTPYRRVWNYSTKPDMKTLRRVTIITGGGAFIVGLIGLIIFTLMSLLPV